MLVLVMEGQQLYVVAQSIECVLEWSVVVSAQRRPVEAAEHLE